MNTDKDVIGFYLFYISKKIELNVYTFREGEIKPLRTNLPKIKKELNKYKEKLFNNESEYYGYIDISTKPILKYKHIHDKLQKNKLPGYRCGGYRPKSYLCNVIKYLSEDIYNIVCSKNRQKIKPTVYCQIIETLLRRIKFYKYEELILKESSIIMDL